MDTVTWNFQLFHCHKVKSMCICSFLCCFCFSLYLTNSIQLDLETGVEFDKEEAAKKAKCRTCYTCILPFCCFPLNRNKLRKKYKIHGNFVSDCCAHMLCHCCAILQEFKESQFRSVEGKEIPSMQEEQSNYSTEEKADGKKRMKVAIKPLSLGN